MCHISLSNLNDDLLNKQMYLLMSMMGSTTQKHGWGYVSGDERSFKCDMPAYLTSNIGTIIHDAKGPVVGHVRMASAGVPITTKNAHPFKARSVYQVHNGTLTPKDESKFTMKEDITIVDDKKQKKTESVKRSDSLVFFERFMEIYRANKEEFVESLKKTMGEFTGKFAFIYKIGGDKDVIYVVRGRTADLHISYLTDGVKKDAKKLGYVINTNKEVLENCTNILSNLHQISSGEELHFTVPVDVDKESIFLAKDVDIEKIGEIKEEFPTSKVINRASSSYEEGWGLDEGSGYNYHMNMKRDEEWKNNNTSLAKTVNHAPELSRKYAENIHSFCMDYTVSTREISLLLDVLYGISMQELDDVLAKHFCGRVLETLRKSALKPVRKDIKKFGSVPIQIYAKYEFPWMLNPKSVQMEIAKEIRKLDRR